jgi:predicted AlkP superfamily pyrophosphatase or phosphodiesterase
LHDNCCEETTPVKRFALATAILAATLSGASAQRPLEPPRPRLIVMLVVDQMRADYIERFQDQWSGGLKRLVRDGAWFRRAAYPYLSTVTCAGHATIATGANPHVHGIIANAWWDRDRNAPTTCTEDPAMVNIGYGVRPTTGDSPARLVIPTLADEMRGQVSAHVVTLALKERSAIMLAGHGGDAVTWLSNSFDGWVTSPAYAKTLVPPVERFAQTHPIGADFGKVWERLMPAARYHSADDGVGEDPPKGWTKTFPHALKGSGRVDTDFYHQWELSPFADTYVAEMAAALTEQMQLGKHDTTDVLAVSFSTPDLVGHAFGPDSQEVEDILAQLDRDIGDLLARLDRFVGKNSYAVALSADHGVTSIPEQLIAGRHPGGRIDTAAVVASTEKQLATAWGPRPYFGRWMGNELYFQPGVYARLRADPKLLAAIMRSIAAAPGVLRVFRSDELATAATASDLDLRAAALSYFAGRSGDLVVSLKAGWMVGNVATTHGSGNPDDQRVPVVFAGPWFQPGRYDDEVTPADIAPTLAHISGVTLPRAEGHPLLKAIASPREGG